MNERIQSPNLQMYALQTSVVSPQIQKADSLSELPFPLLGQTTNETVARCRFCDTILNDKNWYRYSQGLGSRLVKDYICKSCLHKQHDLHIKLQLSDRAKNRFANPYCSLCNVSLDKTNWYVGWRIRYLNGNRSGAHTICISCYRQKQNRDVFRKNRINLHNSKQRELIQEFLGNKCVLCGRTQKDLIGRHSKARFHFHHPGRRLVDRPKGLRPTLKEAKQGKIVLLCIRCHCTINRIVAFKNLNIFEKALEIL